MLAYIKSIRNDGSLLLEVKLFKNDEEVFNEEGIATVDIEKFCGFCGASVFKENSLIIRVENFLPWEDGGKILLKLKTICSCKRKKYKRFFLPGGNFLKFLEV